MTILACVSLWFSCVALFIMMMLSTNGLVKRQKVISKIIEIMSSGDENKINDCVQSYRQNNSADFIKQVIEG